MLETDVEYFDETKIAHCRNSQISTVSDYKFYSLFPYILRNEYYFLRETLTRIMKSIRKYCNAFQYFVRIGTRFPSGSNRHIDYIILSHPIYWTFLHFRSSCCCCCPSLLTYRRDLHSFVYLHSKRGSKERTCSEPVTNCTAQIHVELIQERVRVFI